MVTTRSLCVFCGASKGNDPVFMEVARAFGAEMARRGISLVYGGGWIGLMGAVADGVMENGGHVIGIIPEHLHDIEVGHEGVSELIISKNMYDRKVEMFKRSDAFVSLAGGLGTLDETFEALTLRQLGIHDKPLVFLNTNGYWDKTLAAIDGIIDDGFAKPSNRDLFSVASSIDEVFDQLESAQGHRFDAKEKLV